MKISYYSAIGLLFLFFGCSFQRDESSKNETSPAEIRELVIKAASGDRIANDSLGNFFDYTLPVPGQVNNLIVDSLLLPKKKYYVVLLEHSNPVYNRFAVYDNSLNLYLIDKSLSGNIETSLNSSLRSPLYAIKESFLSKDILQLERLSLYKIDDSTASLSFRSFIKLRMPDNNYEQVIDELSDERIKTSLSSSEPSIINNKGDIFTYDRATDMYFSQAGAFDSFVKNEVQSYSFAANKPQITDRRSALESVGIVSAHEAGLPSNSRELEGYSLTLDESWKEIKGVSISSYLTKELTGTRYLNNNIGASIFIINLNPADSSESLVNYSLNQVSEGKYMLRYSDKIEAGKNYVRFLEYSCGERKFLLIFEASKYTYEKLRPMYEEIFNSFFMEC